MAVKGRFSFRRERSPWSIRKCVCVYILFISRREKGERWGGGGREGPGCLGIMGGFGEQPKSTLTGSFLWKIPLPFILLNNPNLPLPQKSALNSRPRTSRTRTFFFFLLFLCVCVCVGAPAFITSSSPHSLPHPSYLIIISFLYTIYTFTHSLWGYIIILHPHT